MIPDSKLTWFKINPSVFLTSTVGMTNREVGAYIKLLAYSWVNGPLPNSPKVLASIAGKADIELITSRFFEVNGEGKLCDPRLEASRVEAETIFEANRKRTAKAREERWKDDSLSQKPDTSVTATDNKDNDKDPDTTRPLEEKIAPETTPQTVAPTLRLKPSGTQDEKPLGEKPSENASGQNAPPKGEAQGRLIPATSSAQLSPEAEANIARLHAIQQKGPDWED